MLAHTALRSDTKRPDIERAALRLFVTRGLRGTTVRDIAQLGVGRMTYLCWCDDAGKVVDDGTVARLDADEFRVTAAEPALAWLQRHARGFDVSIADSSHRLGALALQGPAAAGEAVLRRAVLQKLAYVLRRRSRVRPS